MTKPVIKGIIPPIVTPFLQNEELNEKALRREVKYMLNANVDGISFGGSTGEGAVLSDNELGRGIEIIREENTKDIPVICGIIRNSTQDAIKAGQAAKERGADVLMVTPIFYFGAFDEHNYEFYYTLANKVGLPIIVYNVIQNNPISPQLMQKISEIEQIIGIKQSYGGIHALTDMISACGDKVSVFSAQDDLLYVSYLLGAVGAISAILSLFPELLVQQWNAVNAGDLDLARDIHYRILPVWRTIEGKAFPSKLKAALNLLGRDVGKAKSPVGVPAQQDVEKIKRELIKAQFLQ